MSNKEFIQREKEIDIEICRIAIKKMKLDLEKLKEDDDVRTDYCV